MSDFNVAVRELSISPHPDADALELARIDDYVAVVPKGQFESGDLAAYIPEGAVVPAPLIEEMGLAGRLAGKDKNRVKAIRLRGVLSQGLVHPMSGFAKGEDVTERLGITKYEPPIPVHMGGQVWNAYGKTLKYDIENIKKYPDVLGTEEPVVVTEKIHGTFCQIGYHNDDLIIASKGLGARGLAFKNIPENDNNVYIQAARRHKDDLDRIHLSHDTFYVLGEIYGKGIQDFQYDTDRPLFRVFDVFIDDPSKYGFYMNAGEGRQFADAYGFDVVPRMWDGIWEDFDWDMVRGKSQIASHMREGVVIKPQRERRDDKLGRVILKALSEDYLLRKGETTEYE